MGYLSKILRTKSKKFKTPEQKEADYKKRVAMVQIKKRSSLKLAKKHTMKELDEMMEDEYKNSTVAYKRGDTLSDEKKRKKADLDFEKAHYKMKRIRGAQTILRKKSRNNS